MRGLEDRLPPGIEGVLAGYFVIDAEVQEVLVGFDLMVDLGLGKTKELFNLRQPRLGIVGGVVRVHGTKTLDRMKRSYKRCRASDEKSEA